MKCRYVTAEISSTCKTRETVRLTTIVSDLFIIIWWNVGSGYPLLGVSPLSVFLLCHFIQELGTVHKVSKFPLQLRDFEYSVHNRITGTLGSKLYVANSHVKVFLLLSANGILVELSSLLTLLSEQSHRISWDTRKFYKVPKLIPYI